MSSSALRFPYTSELELPVIGIEAEFKTWVDGVEAAPEDVWGVPSSFIDRPLLKRSRKASQLPTGGAVYFDGGVLEVVTPVIEIASQCTGRVVRSLWEQISFVREQLDRWEKRVAREVRLQAFSSHFNVSFELARPERSRDRTIQKLAGLLANLLPAPVLVAGANRLSSGVGVRPRRDRIEITLDFTPDPSLMAATAALIVGIVRETIAWPSYRLAELDARGIPRIAGLSPGRHPTRKGWVAKKEHFPRNPFEGRIDDALWDTTEGRLSLREIARRTAVAFEPSIRRWADPFGHRVLFGVLDGEVPSLLELPGRPPSYDDIGHAARWGHVIPELQNLAPITATKPGRRRADVDVALEPPWRGARADRRERVALPPRLERRASPDRRSVPPPPAAQRLSRSAYESVFRNVARGKRLIIEDEVLTPVRIKGWYHAMFENETGEERMLSIDQVVHSGGRWQV